MFQQPIQRRATEKAIRKGARKERKPTAPSYIWEYSSFANLNFLLILVHIKLIPLYLIRLMRNTN